MRKICQECGHLPECTWPKTGKYVCGCFEYPAMTPGEMPTDAELIRALRESWYEQSKLITSLLVARTLDLAMVASLIDHSPDPEALSELRGIIMQAVQSITGLRRGIIEIPRTSGTNQGG